MSEAKKDELIRKLYAYLKEISKYQTPERLRKHSQRDWGCDYQEALEMVYENVLETAKQGIKGVRLP